MKTFCAQNITAAQAQAHRRPPLLTFSWVLILALACCAAAGRSLPHTRSTTEPGDALGTLALDAFRADAEGKRGRRIHQRTRIHTEHAIDALGDPRIVHNSAVEQLRVVRAVTTMRDGTQVPIKPNSITETTPSSLANAPAYADLRETVVTLTGIERGCETDLEVEITHGTQDQNSHMWAQVPLHKSFPIAERVVQISAPPGTSVSWACLGCSALPTPAEQQTATAVEHRFTWRNLPALNLHEIDGPHRHHVAAYGAPRLVFSTAPSWSALTEELGARIDAAAKPTEAVHEQAAKITKNLVLEQERRIALWRFVAQRIRSVSWPIADFDFTPSPAGNVLERSYGHGLDKAVLLLSLLRAADIAAWPVLLSHDGLFAEDVPALPQFSEVWIVAQGAHGEEHWLSPTAMLAGPAESRLAGRYALSLKRAAAQTNQPVRLGQTTTTDTQSEDASTPSQSQLVAEIKVGSDGALSADMQVTLSGAYNPFLEVTDKADADKLAKGVLSGLGPWSTTCEGCFQRLRSLSLTHTHFSYKASAEGRGTSRIVEVRLPWVARSQINATSLARSARQTAMALPSRGVEHAVLTVSLPEDLELSSALNASSRVENSVGRVVTESKQQGNKLRIERTLRLNKRIIDASSYQDLRALATELFRADATTLLLTRRRDNMSGRDI